MIIGISGFLGDGKTILMVRYAKSDYAKGRKIYGNLALKHIPYDRLNISDFIDPEQSAQFNNATILIDEITLFMDCRRSSKKENIALSILLRQSRKRNIDIYYTCQDFSEVDLRLIRFTSIFIFAQRCFTEEGNTLKELEHWRNYTVLDDRQRHRNIVRFNMDISQYYDDYDTEEIIEGIYDAPKRINKPRCDYTPNNGLIKFI